MLCAAIHVTIFNVLDNMFMHSIEWKMLYRKIHAIICNHCCKQTNRATIPFLKNKSFCKLSRNCIYFSLVLCLCIHKIHSTDTHIVLLIITTTIKYDRSYYFASLSNDFGLFVMKKKILHYWHVDEWCKL